MALINCPECGKQISDKASQCIHCGCPISQTSQSTQSQKTASKSTNINKMAPMRIFSQSEATVNIECGNCNKVYSYNKKYFSHIEDNSCIATVDIICPNCSNGIPTNTRIESKVKTTNIKIKSTADNITKDYLPKNDSIDDDVPMPTLTKPIALAIGAVLILIGLIIIILSGEGSFFENLFLIIILIVLFVAYRNSMKDYNLAQTDFAQYRNKVLKDKAYEKAIENANKDREERERKQRAELLKKRDEYSAKGIPTCPKCGSPSIATINRGYSLVWGVIGSGKPVNVCQKCGHKWEIGK